MKKLLVLGLAVVTFFSANLAVSAAGLADVFSAEYYADTYEDRKQVTSCYLDGSKESKEYTRLGYLISSECYYSNGNKKTVQRYDILLCSIISETNYYEDGSLQHSYENYPGTVVAKTFSQYGEGGILQIYTENDENGMAKKVVEYHENGNKKLEVTYDESGTELTRQAWDEDGNEIAED